MTEIEQWKAIASDWEDACRDCQGRELALYNDMVGMGYDVAELRARVAELEAWMQRFGHAWGNSTSIEEVHRIVEQMPVTL